RLIEETGEVDVVMIAMNFVDRHTYGFEETVLPVARKHGVGVMAMKVFGGVRGGVPGYGDAEPRPSQMDAGLLSAAGRYVVSLEGVTGLGLGPPAVEPVRRNIELVSAAKPLAGGEMKALLEKGKSLAAAWGPRFGPVA